MKVAAAAKAAPMSVRWDSCSFCLARDALVIAVSVGGQRRPWLRVDA
jgi:hypothetical protein